jgi:3-phosphoshikimate 1-carboxyvinyltransferase
VTRLAGAVEMPGDKSISHRAALFGAIAEGRTEITGFLEGEDCLATIEAARMLGANVARKGPGHFVVDGVGLAGLGEPDDVIDCGNSGTTARLLLGVLAGQPFWTVLTGDASLRRRPMGRVAEPLRRMGATVVGRDGGTRLPLAVGGARPLRALAYRSPVASAQVKTALLLAGLWADGPVSVEEPARSRDHTERMLRAFGARLDVEERRVTITPGSALRGQPVAVPADISSAAYFLVAASIIREARVTVKSVGVNPTRAGILEVLAAMGARVTTAGGEASHGEGPGGAGEPAADLTVESAELRGADVAGELIPRLIDEVPVLAVAACAATGLTRVRDAAELRVKESDRIRAIATELGRMGAEIVERPDGLEIQGGRRLRGATVASGGDHRMAMALVVAALAAEGPSIVEDTECIATSFPGFVDTVNALAGAGCAVAVP